MGVKQHCVVAGAVHGENARALAVVYGGLGGSYEVPLQQHRETFQPTGRTGGLGRVVSGGPQASGWTECMTCCLQGLEEQKCTVLELTCRGISTDLFIYFIIKSFEDPPINYQP